jgi:hypothetical protein
VNLRKDHYRLTGPASRVSRTRGACAPNNPIPSRPRAIAYSAIVRAPRHPRLHDISKDGYFEPKTIHIYTVCKNETPDPERRITWLVDR